MEGWVGLSTNILQGSIVTQTIGLCNYTTLQNIGAHWNHVRWANCISSSCLQISYSVYVQKLWKLLGSRLELLQQLTFWGHSCMSGLIYRHRHDWLWKVTLLPQTPQTRGQLKKKCICRWDGRSYFSLNYMKVIDKCSKTGLKVKSRKLIEP